jgi:septum formation protein
LPTLPEPLVSASQGSPAAPRLVLASTSQFRRQLLERLGLHFTVAAPQVDETVLPGELPIDLVSRLARAKAEIIARRHPQSVVIGSDQAALQGRDILGKPGTVERCIEQLRASSGQRVTFSTAVHIIRSDSGSNESHLDTTTVHFRRLDDEEIRRYVEREKPLQCAGSFKVEGLGISLLERIESQDPTALIGLPLIWVAGALRRAGLAVP